MAKFGNYLEICSKMERELLSEVTKWKQLWLSEIWRRETKQKEDLSYAGAGLVTHIRLESFLLLIYESLTHQVSLQIHYFIYI